jgi:hypothetical protein
MAVHENVGFDFQHIAHDAFRRMAAAVDLWRQAFDNDAPAAEIGRRPGHRMTLRRPVRLKRALVAPGMKEAKFQWFKDKRPAGFQTHGDPERSLVDKRPKQPTCLAQETSGLNRQGPRGIGIEHQQEGLVRGERVAAGEAKKRHTLAAGRADPPDGRLDIEPGMLCAQHVESGNVFAQIQARHPPSIRI